MDQIFKDKFESLIESFSSRNKEQWICEDFTYQVHDPAQKPYSSEFKELLDINNSGNHMCWDPHMPLVIH